MRMYFIQLLFVGSLLTGCMGLSSNSFSSNIKNQVDSFLEHQLKIKHAATETVDVPKPGIYVKVELGRAEGTNRKGKPCNCFGVCFGLCSIEAGINNRIADDEHLGYLDFDDNLNVARIYFMDSIDFSDPNFVVSASLLLDLNSESNSGLKAIQVEPGHYQAIAHEGSLRVNHTEVRYTGYVDLNVNRF